MAEAIGDYRRQGISIAIDDFGSGHSGVDLLAEGVETLDEFQLCRSEGIELFQGYLLGRPALEQLVAGSLPTLMRPQVVG